MFWLIETSEQLEEFYNKGYKEIFIEIIPFNNRIHPCNNYICGFYIKPLYSADSFLITVSHMDTRSAHIGAIMRAIGDYMVLYGRDKKEILHYINHPNIIDLTLNQPYEVEYTPAHKFFYNKYPNKSDINRIIPIVKHFEYCEKIYNDLKQNIEKPVNEFFNNKTSIIFNLIESEGLKIDKNKFEKYFKPIDKDFVYTQYNFKTTTTRPSNKFGNINYAALNKENGERSCFIPRNDLLVEFDIKAYHPTLLAKLINYEFGETNIYEYFSKLYNTDIQEAKLITFRQLYGGIYEQYKHLDFFIKTQNYIDELWNEFTNKGYVECKISKHKFEKDKLIEMNPHKLLNYVLQNLETSLNVVMMFEMFKLLKDKKTKLIYYCYDSFLFDLDLEEQDLIEQIQQIFIKYKLKIKINKGKNYGFSNS